MSLTPKAFDLLCALVEASGRVVSKEDLMERVWPDVEVEEGNLTQTISVLRRRLGEGANGAGQGRTLIETIPRRGYRFVPQVRVLDPCNEAAVRAGDDNVDGETKASEGAKVDSGEPATNEVGQATVAKPLSSNESKARRFFGRKEFVPAAALLCVVALLCAAMYWTRARERRSGARGGRIDSVAVLPLTLSNGGETDAEYLAEGITGSLVDRLAHLPGLKVTARSLSRRYQGQWVDARQAGRELDVRAVLAGQIARRGDELHLEVELVDVATGARLWGAQYNRPFADLLIVEDEVATNLAESLRRTLTPAERQQLTRDYTQNAEAYRLFLKGRYFWNRRTREGFQKAIESFNQAIELDPGYAPAYVGLADCYNLSAEFRILEPGEAYGHSKAAIKRALEFDDQLAAAYTSRGWARFAYDWDWEGAEEDFRRALELDPQYDLAHHWYATYLSAMGRHEEALARINRALELDPLSVATHVTKGTILYRAHRFDEARAQLQKALELDPHHINAVWWVGLTYGVERRYAEAMAANIKAGEMSKIESPASIYAAFGDANAEAGFRAYIRHLLAMSLRDSKKFYVAPTDIAEYYSALDEKGRSLDWLERAYATHAPLMCYLKVDPRWDDVRDEPRFPELLRRMRLN